MLLFLILAARKMRISGFQKKLQIIVRFFVCLLLIFSLGTMTVQQYAKSTTTIFAVDRSASIKSAEENTKFFLSEAEKTIGEADRAGVVSFGENASVEKGIDKTFSLTEFNATVNRDYTNISDALKLSATLIPENSRKRIVLISDGNENVDDALSQARILKNQKITVDVYAVNNNIGSEVQLTGIKVPPFSNKNVDFDIEIMVDSLHDTKSNVKLYKGSQLIVNEEITVRQGENKYVFSDHSSEGGGIIYRAEIVPEKDTMSENNKAFAYCYVKDVPSMLLVEQNGSGSEIKRILEGAQIHVASASPETVPTALEVLNGYDSIVLADVPSDGMAEGFLQALESYVRHTGGGLIVTGGENSYALGNYYNTVLEELLPVSMELKTDSQTPDLGMVMVVDHSGSMSDSRYGLSVMEIAKEAAIRGVESLNENDMVGVVAFDDQPEWAVEFQKVSGNIASIQENIAKIQPAGGTSILPALLTAYEKLKLADVKLKHIILLTDGQAEQIGYDSILQGMNNSGITLSTVAVGSGADTKLLEGLAKSGKGRYYFTNEFTNLPEIFAKEALLAGKEYINNRDFYPTQKNPSPMLAGVDSVAMLKGYIGVTAKPRADVLLESDTKDPVLASWQYGLGRTIAWTSDMNGKWTQEWLASEQGVQLFKNMVSWSMRSQSSEDIQVEGERTEHGGRLTVTMKYDQAVERVTATVLSSDNKEYQTELTASAPGVYNSELDGAQEGAYIVNVQVDKKDGTSIQSNSGFNLPYSKEYDIRNWQDGKLLLKKIADTTGGKILETPQEVFSEDTEKIITDIDMSKVLLVAAVLLFLIDIAIRRFTSLSQWLENICCGLGKRFNRLFKRNNRKLDLDTTLLSKKKEQEVQTKKESTVKNDSDLIKEEKKSTASLLANQKKKRNK